MGGNAVVVVARASARAICLRLMETVLAERIAGFAEIIRWLYIAIGLVVFWVYSYFFRDSKLIFPLLKRPTLNGASLLFAIWVLSGISNFVAKRLVENNLPEVSVATIVHNPISLETFFYASLEELRRSGFYQLFAGYPLIGIWLNTAFFGFSHLAYRGAEIANYPLILLMLPLSMFATGLSFLAVVVRMGLVWAILVHFANSTVRFVVITENIVVNYLLFFASVLCLLWIGSLNLRKAIFDQRVQEKDLDP